jgi:hypothetical protein
MASIFEMLNVERDVKRFEAKIMDACHCVLLQQVLLPGVDGTNFAFRGEGEVHHVQDNLRRYMRRVGNRESIQFIMKLGLNHRMTMLSTSYMAMFPIQQ